ncbi:MAG: hypothetical protein H0V11_02410 [Actinobacteria bacterium]|nr:hypothetical protein [Actinomycetota bacterium]
MSPDLAQREIAIAAVALLAIVLGLALGSQRGESSTRVRLPESIPAPDGGWYHARAAATGRDLTPGATTACGQRVMGSTIGIAHPVLPCGVKLYIGNDESEVLTQVIGRGPEAPNVQFGLTDALARTLGVDGRETIRWRYAR